MNHFRKALIFVSAPVLGFIIPPIFFGLISTAGPVRQLVPLSAWILLTAAIIISVSLATIWSRILYPRLKHSLEQKYQGKWEKGELMVATSAMISTLALGLLYRPCIFTEQPYCRGFMSSTDLLLETALSEGPAFNTQEQKASAVLGSFSGLIITFTIALDEIFSRLLFYWHHRNQ